MLLHLFICCLVGSTLASTNPGWKDNTEYVFKIRGRTLASLHEVADQYSGILLKSEIKIQPKSNGKIQGQISKIEFSQVHSQLHDGWNTAIPDSEVSYKPVPVSTNPFQIEMKDGVIRDLIVNKDIPNWEANIIKSIVSQFQLNTKGIDHIPSKVSVFPKGSDNSAVFKVMEDTVTGRTETVYDIHPIPEYVLQSKPWLARHIDLKGEGEVIEVVKHKNFSNSEELPLFHYGFGEMKNTYPGTNQMGHFFVRDSITRAILTGNLKRYTLQHTFTVNEIVMSPSFNNKQKGSVVSMLNVTLKEVKPKGQDIPEVSNPIPLGNLVYSYDDPKSGLVIQKRPSDGRDSWEEPRRGRSATMERMRRSIRNSDDTSTSDSSSSEERKYYQHKLPELKDAPKDPLLPYTTGFQGKSIKNDPDVNIKKTVHKIAQDIGRDMQNPDDFLNKNTLSKYITMAHLIRLMDFQELKQVAIDLYSQNKDGPQRDSWTAFRDAVADSGTGPAFLTIQDWIQSGKIEDEEAAEVISAMTDSVGEPTKDFMKSYFDFIRDSKVKSQKELYESALLAYSNLVREVCVDRKQSKRQYPVNSYGKFCTDEMMEFVEKSIIPYLTKQLHEAISHADTEKIHAYIRALGNVGHKKILAAFKPYIEGEKQASQFQRLLMVMAMDKLTETEPKVARSVLYNVYQNAGETQEVRVAAVYQLIRTSPPTDMLQRMASYTNIDTQEHVNAAVKSCIEDAAKLEGAEHHWLRSSAEAAKPLLNNKKYGMQHGRNFLRSYVIDELKLKYKQNVQFIGNEEEFYPKGVRYSIRDNLGGLKRRIATLQAIISSTDELFHEVQYQTSRYQEKMQEQKQNAQQQKQHPFSSLNIAHLLNIKVDEREQFEGNVYSELQGAFHRFWSFDNHTIEKFPEEIRKYEEEIKNGKNYHYTKISNNREMVLSFPTDTGLPFLFSYASPMSVKTEGNIRGEASPQLVSDGKLHWPDTVDLKVNMGFTVNAKTESRLSFITPFDGQRYISGFDKNMQCHIPIIGYFKVDMKNKQFVAEIENKEIHHGAKLFHYSTWPYTSRVDIKNFQPVSTQQHTQQIKQENLRSYDEVFGKKTGIAFRIQIEHGRQFINFPWLGQILQSRNIVTGLWKLWDDASIQHGQINIQVKPEQSAAQKYIVRGGYNHKYIAQSKQGKEAGSPDWEKYYNMTDHSKRRDDFIDIIGAGINSASVCVCDASIEFQGSKDTKYYILAGVGKSNVDPKSRFSVYYKKYDSQSDNLYEMSLEAKSYIPNTNGLDVMESFKTEPITDTTVQVSFGKNGESPSKAEFKVELRRSEDRKRYLMELPMYKECKREMGEGNHQLPACANMTMSSNLLDRVNIKVQHDNIKQDMKDNIKSIYEAFKMYYYPTLEVDNKEGTGQENHIHFQARFDPDLRSVNISFKTKDQKATINTIQIQEWAQKLFVVHPVFHLRSRIYGAGLGLHTYRPICVIDQTHASTFNNRTYPIPLDRQWTVLLHYVPKDARHSDQQKSVEEMLRYQPENYAVFVRQSTVSPQKKDVKITLSSPETKYKVIDITMQPSSDSGSKDVKAKVTVDGQEVEVNSQKSYDIRDGYIQIYSLPNGEVKFEVMHAFYAIYDGHRIKVTVVNGKFRDSIRGLCGVFNDDKFSDFLTSENCVARDPKDFIKSFEVEGIEGQQKRKEFTGRTKQCVYKEVPSYANVISEYEANDESYPDSLMREPKGTKFQTRYVENGDEICFTIRPVPVCSSRSQQRGSQIKHVPVHCVQNSNVAQLWKKQIDRGASPDFSHKKESRSVQIEVPKSCSQ